MVVEVIIVVQAHLAVAVISLRARHWNLVHWDWFTVNSLSFRPLTDECDLLMLATNFFYFSKVLDSVELLIKSHTRIHAFRTVEHEVNCIKV